MPRADEPARERGLSLFVVRGRRFLAEALSETLRGDGGLRVIGIAPGAAAAIERLHGLAPDVVLVDASDERARALDRVRRLRDAHPALKLLAFGVADDLEAVVAFAEAGARACLPRDAALGELADAVRELARRRTRCAPPLVARLIERLAAMTREDAAAAPPAEVELTGREREVLRHLADGLTNKEIAQRLEVAVATVKNHVHNLLGKLGAHRRQDAVRTAYLNGLVDDFLPRRPELRAVR